MAGQNTLIIATDYNAIQSKIALILGSGSGTTGYGQSVASAQVAQYSKITVDQWNNLRTDIIKCRQHQTGNVIGSKAPEDVGYVAGSDLPIPSSATQVKESWRAAYMAMATDAETWHNSRILANNSVSPPAGEATLSSLVAQQVRTAAWNGQITQTVVVTWPTADDARYFFNTGGQIRFSSDLSGGLGGPKNVSWQTLLNTMGTISLNYTATTATGSSGGYTVAPSSLGFNDLSTSDNTIFECDTLNTSTYYPNKYYIYGRVNSTSDRRILYLRITWADDSVAPVSRPDPGWGIDENVDGTLTSTVQVYRASGTNVSVPAPSASTTAIA